MSRVVIIFILMITGLNTLYAGRNNFNYHNAVDTAVKGTVLDEYGHPLAGVSVMLKGSALPSVVSDNEGSFEMIILPGSTLVLSHPKYYAQEVKILNNQSRVVQLSLRYLQSPDQVDVLYETKDKNKILGSVSTIYTPQLTTTAAPLYAYSLAGRLPGLYTQQTRGFAGTGIGAITGNGIFGGEFPTSFGATGPNDNTEISLRLRGQSPVTIIDGMQRSIYTINPENIESISVLKDALSTILLGVGGSRGAVLVTTKKPIPGPPQISFTAQTGIQSPLKLPDPLPSYQYAYLFNEAALNAGGVPIYSYEDFEAYRTHSSPYTHPDVNWFNTILNKNSAINNLSLMVSGGGAAARYEVGLSYLDQKGLFKDENPDYNANAEIQRYTINTNIDVNVTKNFTTQLQLFARIQDGNQPGATTDGIIRSMYITPSNAYPVFNPDGTLGTSAAFTATGVGANVYGQVNNSGYISDYTRDIVANLVLNYKFDNWIKGLWARVQTNLSVYASSAINRSFQKPTTQFGIGANGDTSYTIIGRTVNQSNSFAFTYTAQYFYLQTALGYNRQFGKHNIGGKLFYDRNEAIFNYDLPKTNQNIAATVSYDYDRKYFAEVAVNYSGCDRYPPGKQFGLFYAGGLGWDMAQETFIKDNTSLNWLNKIKLRATYGETGNDNVGYFTWRSTYSTNQLTGTTALTQTFSIYAFGANRSIQSGYAQDLLPNPNVTWEKGQKLNAGIDLAFLKNHLMFTAEYYNNKYYDLLQQRGKQSSLIGISYPLENLGINRYTGWEFTLTYQNNYKDFNYFLSANGSFEKSEIIYMDEIVQKYPWNVHTGQPVNMMYGYIADGFIQTQEEAETHATISGYTLQPGDLKLRDLNEDGFINQYDQTAIGTTKPLFYYGITGGVSYKGFDVSVLLQGVQNRKIFFVDDTFGGLFESGLQGYDYYIGRWTPETATSATLPRLTNGYNQNNSVASSFWVRSGDYFRIKNVDIGYTFPYKLTSRLKLSSLRVFANALNLFTYSKFDRIDPEVYGRVYPIQRVINFGINIKF